MLARRTIAALSLVLGLGAASARQGEDKKPEKQPELHPVSGTVTLDGRPLFRAIVTFHQADAKKPKKLKAETDEEGKYRLTTAKPGDGIPAGDYLVTFSFPERDKDGKVKEGGKEFLPQKYVDAERAVIKVTVTPGKNELNFNLASR